MPSKKKSPAPPPVAEPAPIIEPEPEAHPLGPSAFGPAPAREKAAKPAAAPRSRSPFMVLGRYPLSNWVVWMGANGAGTEETLHVLSELGHDPASINSYKAGPRAYLADRLSLGRCGNFKYVKPSEVSPEHVAQLSAIVKAFRARASEPEDAAPAPAPTPAPEPAPPEPPAPVEKPRAPRARKAKAPAPAAEQ